jgi:hypothetical protein
MAAQRRLAFNAEGHRIRAEIILAGDGFSAPQRVARGRPVAAGTIGRIVAPTSHPPCAGIARIQ